MRAIPAIPITLLSAGLLLTTGCEQRTQVTPPEPSLAWRDAPLWYDQPGLLVPPGPRAGNRAGGSGGGEARTASQREEAKDDDKDLKKNRDKSREPAKASDAESKGADKPAKPAKSGPGDSPKAPTNRK